MENDWISFKDEQPAEMQCVLVKDGLQNVYYAVYVEAGRFDVHRPALKKPSQLRTAWSRFSYQSFPYWKPIHNA